MGNLAYGLIAPGAIISQVPQVRQTTLQFVQQFRMVLREESYGAEKKVLDRHLAATSLYDLRGAGLVLQVAHGTTKPFAAVLFFHKPLRRSGFAAPTLFRRNGGVLA